MRATRRAWSWTRFNDGGRLISSGSGAIQVTADGNGARTDFGAGADSVIGGPSATGAITINADSIDWSGTLSVESDGALRIQPRTASTTIGIGGGSGTLNLDDTALSYLADGFSSITIGDAAAGTGAVDINASTFTDPVTIVGGSVDVDGLDAGTNAATLTARTGAITSPAGVAGALTDVTASTLTVNGNLAPGASPGQMVVDGNVTFDGGDTYSVELEGTTPGSGHDQLRVEGSTRVVTLGGATLAASTGGAYTPGSTDSLVIIDNVEADSSVVGTFADLNDGDQLFISCHPFTIDYDGGTNSNDVVLSYNPTPVISGTGVDDDFYIQISGGNIEVYAGTDATGTLVMQTPMANLTEVTIDGTSGDDRFIIDYVAGMPNIVIDGGRRQRRSRY